jgi:transposase InsO family protein
LNVLCEAAGISRQSYFKWFLGNSTAREETAEEKVIELALTVRRRYLPGSSARELYSFIRKNSELDWQLIGWSKHRFEALCLNNGLRVKKIRFVPKTTQRGDFIFPNLIAGLEIRDINTVLVSDICYIFGTPGKLIGYATTLMDIYSRFLIGLSFSKDMRAVNTTIPVIRQAFSFRKKEAFNGCILHSDGGRQYIKKEFLQALKSACMESSMAENCYENAHAEALNDTLKNHMLVDMEINSFAKLKRHEEFIKMVYNHNKSHSGIGGLTPCRFEQKIASLQSWQRTVLNIKPINPQD